ncbi:MAG: non-canonical purine NTP diphosphatase [Prevotellaceae bacterium]|jgi:XTP/dITP diphosphohydrolase|nr:non-canonical purine NTP diphosphatase [Prevotellaceae bacterium]
MDLIFATNSKHKLEEVSSLLKGDIALSTLAQHGITEEIPEERKTLKGNALQKARYVYDKLHEDCFADDTGLEVEALNGAPGVYSARYAGEPKNMEANKQKLLQELRGKANRTACFRTAIALVLGGREYLFEGKVKGQIIEEERGEGGFGYDGLFVPEGYDRSFAQMSLEEKNVVSHRAEAVRKLVDFLNGW